MYPLYHQFLLSNACKKMKGHFNLFSVGGVSPQIEISPDKVMVREEEVEFSDAR